MTLLQRIKMLLQDRRMTVSDLERALGFSQGSIGKWDRVSPSFDRLEKVADYFHISMDYLIGRQSYEQMKLAQAREEFAGDHSALDTEMELRINRAFRMHTEGLNEEEKERFTKTLDSLMATAVQLLKQED